MPTSVELRTERAKLVTQARSIYDKAAGEKRAPNAEERQQFDTIMADVDRMGDEANRIERLETVERSLDQSAGRRTASPPPGDGATRTTVPGNPRASEAYMAAFRNFLRGGSMASLRGEQLQAVDAVASMPEYRGLQADIGVQGGYMLAPQQFLDEIIIFVNNLVYIRQLATKFTVANAASLGVPSLDVDAADDDWTSELNTGTEDTSLAFGKRELIPRPFAKRLKISKKLLRMVPKAETVALERLGYKAGITQEKAFLSGNGQNQPLGLFTASSNGIDTSRDVTSISAGVISADDLIALKYSLKIQYQQSKTTRFILNRNCLSLIRQLKDVNHQYLWQPAGLGSNLTQDGIDRLLEVPVIMSEYAPDPGTTNSGITSGLYPILFGDLKFYWIADALNWTLERLDELYAETNQVGFIARMELDGMPVLAEAFGRLKIQ